MAKKAVKKDTAKTSSQSAVRRSETKAVKAETVAAPKAAKTETKVEVYLQFGDREVRVSEIMQAAEDDFHGKESDTAIQSVQLYLKPEDCAAYYVANGAFSGKVAM
jgi:uncharacterized membrane protein YqiK